MSALSSLKLACEKHHFKSFNVLEPGEYIVQSFTKVKTNYGDRIRIDLDDCYMYLPERFTKILFDDKLAELNRGPKIMNYSGKDSECKNR